MRLVGDEGDLVPVGLVAFDDEGNVNACDALAGKLLGRSPEELTGPPLPPVIAETARRAQRARGEVVSHVVRGCDAPPFVIRAMALRGADGIAGAGFAALVPLDERTFVDA